MNAYLKCIETGETFELEGVSFVGRNDESLVRLDDPWVSRRHAMIRMQEGGHFLFDLGSFNGSYLNGSRLTAGRRLHDGDVLSFAEHEFQFEQLDTREEGEGSDEEAVESLGASTIALIRSSPVILLTCDIKGFTALSEAIPADQLARIIGGWYADCERIMAEERGTVDKFIGDCVLAYWMKVDEPSQRAALRAAQKLVRSCRRIHEEWADLFEQVQLGFEVGVAIHTGKVAYGGMSQGEFTLVGDPVNLAFRLEALTRTLDCDVLVSGDFTRSLPPELARECCRSLGVHQVRGRNQTVEVHAVTAFPGAGEGDS